MPTAAAAERRRLGPSGVAAIAAGAALLVWMVARAGTAGVAADVGRIGWGLVLIVAFGGLRFVVRAQAWRMCLDGPHGLALRDTVAASICGDTLGNLTPLGPLVGEPAKAAFVRQRLPLADAVASLATENILYALSAAAMIAAGMIVLLVRYELPRALRGAGEASIAATAVLFGVALWLLWKQPAIVSRALGAAPPMRRYVDSVRDVESRVYAFASRRPGALLAVGAAEASFHALGVLEIHVTLWLLSGRTAWPPLLTSFIFEAANRLITVVFKFIPLRLGVDEAGTAFFAGLLGLDTHVGVSLGLIRKFRILVWSAVGGLLFIRHGLRRAK